MKRIIAIAATIAVAGCSTLQSAVKEATVEAAATKQPAADPNATELRARAEQVTGRPAPLPGAPSLGEDGRFPDAISYAEQTNSFALLIWHDGHLRVEQYMNGALPESTTRSNSMHKTVLALLVGVAIRDGHISGIDAPVGDYITEWSDDPRGEITIGNLLAMSTGLQTFSREGGQESEWLRFNRDVEAEELLLSRKALRKPGTDFEYLNVNSDLLGLALRRAVGTRYSDFLSSQLWQPIGADTAYVLPIGEHGSAITAANLLARARDWLRIGLLIKDDGQFAGQQIVPSDWVKQMVTPSETNPNYGMQVWRASPYVAERYYNDAKKGFMVPASAPALADDLVYLDGFGGQRVYVSKEEDLVIVRLGPTTLDWDEAILPNAVLRALGDAAR